MKQSEAKIKSIFSLFIRFFCFFCFFHFFSLFSAFFCLKFFASLRFSNFCFEAKQSEAKFKSIFLFFSLFLLFLAFFSLFLLFLLTFRFASILIRLIFAYFTFVFASDFLCFALKWIVWNQAFFQFQAEWNFRFNFSFCFWSESESAPYTSPAW